MPSKLSNATKISKEICRIKEEFKMFSIVWTTCLQILKWLKPWEQ